jgi:hypothetical protein
MAYTKTKLKSSGDKGFPYFRPFLIGKLSEKCLLIQTSLYSLNDAKNKMTIRTMMMMMTTTTTTTTTTTKQPKYDKKVKSYMSCYTVHIHSNILIHPYLFSYCHNPCDYR